jgi:hypothetical protein
MAASNKLDEKSLAQKIRWEGGLWAALEYGLKAERIADPELAELWARLERGYREMAPLMSAASQRLDVAA